MKPRLTITVNNETTPTKPAHKPRSLSVNIPMLLANSARSPTPTPHSKHRRRSSYVENVTAALSSPISQDMLKAKQNDPATLVELSKALIIEHAARRVDLFFYTLIAYHNTHRLVWQGHVDLQHGRGRGLEHGAVTEACHSSLLPALDDLEEKAVDEFLPHYTSILAGTHFMDSLNATVELPGVVNTIDDTLENTQGCRQKSLAIIQDVSSGKRDPLQGLQQFLEMMTQAFQAMVFTDPLSTRIAELQRRGTFTNKYSAESKTINLPYVESLLRLSAEEKTGTVERAALYAHQIQLIQTEIHAAKGHSRPHTPRWR